MLADDFSSEDRRRVVNAGIRHGRDAAMRRCRANADLGVTHVTSTVIATRGERLVLMRARYSSTTSSGPRHSTSRCSTSSRSTPTSGSWRSSRSTSTTSTPPSRSSTPATSPAKRPPTRTRGRHRRGGLRRAQPARTSCDDAGLGERRPSAGDIDGARRHDRILRAAGTIAPTLNIYVEAVHRLERPRSGRHPCGKWDLARGL